MVYKGSNSREQKDKKDRKENKEKEIDKSL